MNINMLLQDVRDLARDVQSEAEDHSDAMMLADQFLELDKTICRWQELPNEWSH